MDCGELGTGVQLPDLVEVAAEERLLERASAQDMIGEPQDRPAFEGGVVAGTHRLQSGMRPGGRLPTEQRVQHGHEVALAGPEGARQERSRLVPDRIASLTKPSAEWKARSRSSVTT